MYRVICFKCPISQSFPPLLSRIRIPLILHPNISKSPNRASDMNVFKVETSQSPAKRPWFTPAHELTCHPVAAKSLGTSPNRSVKSRRSRWGMRPGSTTWWRQTQTTNHHRLSSVVYVAYQDVFPRLGNLVCLCTDTFRDQYVCLLPCSSIYRKSDRRRNISLYSTPVERTSVL